MKLLPVILAHAAALTASAQQLDITNQMQSAGFTVTSRAEHQRVWSKLSLATNSGIISILTNNITELSTGLHRWVSNHWVVATPEIVLTSTGIVARGASHSALFATNANTYSALQTRLPDGQVLQSHVLGLAYQDQATGSNLMFAVLKDCTAQIVGNKRLAYLSCFDGAEASLVYSYSKA